MDRLRTIRLLTADDHAVTRQGLGLLLSHVEDIQLVGAATDGRKAVQIAREQHPQVALLDAIMPGLNGLEATRQMKRALPDIRVVILSGHVDEDQLVSALRAG